MEPPSVPEAVSLQEVLAAQPVELSHRLLHSVRFGDVLQAHRSSENRLRERRSELTRAQADWITLRDVPGRPDPFSRSRGGAEELPACMPSPSPWLKCLVTDAMPSGVSFIDMTDVGACS
jgi:hypothetical protein